MAKVKKKSYCRLCFGRNLIKSIDLGKSPLANEFLDKKTKLKKYPLVVLRCKNCNHLQLSHVVDKNILFKNYLFVSGTSLTNIKHFKNYANECSKRFLGKNSKVLDIASNDGSFLNNFKKQYLRVGIDPAKNIVSKLNKKDLKLETKFFNFFQSKKLKKKYGYFNLITANNVCAHIDNFYDFTKGVKNILAPNGVFIFEVGYFYDVFKNKTFDTIYHEHLDYHLLSPLIKFFKKFDMEIFDVKNIFIQGGSLRIYVCHRNSRRILKNNINKVCNLEKKINFSNQKNFKFFQEHIDNIKVDLNNIINDLKNKNYKMAGYGASAKSTTFLNYFKIKNNKLEFIADMNKLKQYKFAPGNNIKILPPKEIKNKKIDIVIILSWNFASEIITQNKEFLKNGGIFIIPFPKIIKVDIENYKKFYNNR